MMRHQHIALSRGIAGLIFALSLVLTPRAWVESEAEPLVPLEELEHHPTCVDCEDTKPECSETARQEDNLWLNPDEPIPSSQTPCIRTQGTSPGS